MGLVTVTAFEDLACGDCADYAHMLETRLAPIFGRRVTFVQKDFPREKHEWAYDAAVAARYLANHWPAAAHRFRRFCMRERHGISAANLDGHFESFVSEAGIDAPPFAAVVRDEDSRAAVARDLAEGRARGVDWTPTVFAGETVFVEMFDVEAVTAAIEALLAAAALDSKAS